MNPCVGCGQQTVGRCCVLCVMRRRDLKALHVLTLRAQGASFAEMGKVFSRSVERMRQITWYAERKIFRIMVDGDIKHPRVNA